MSSPGPLQGGAAGAPLVLGLDIGGSSTRARLSQGGRTLAEATASGANVTTIDPEVVEERLRDVIGKLGSPLPAACCAGAAGSEVPAGKRRLEELLAMLFPGSRILVVHDARLVLAAAGLESGIALIAGTGSVAYARDTAGAEARFGGWGWLLGDEGGGAWIAREALRELMRRHEAGEPAGTLGGAMLNATHTDDVLDATGRVQRHTEPGQWAVFAGVVFESCGTDPGAARIIDHAAQELALLAERAGAQLSIQGPVVMAGGLAVNFPDLVRRVQARIGPTRVLHQEPVAGAVRLAESL